MVGNSPLSQFTHNQIYNAFKKVGIKLRNHAISRLKDIRTAKLGFKTPNDIMRILIKKELLMPEKEMLESLVMG